mgnify:CR=1 FL=1
MRSLSMVVLSLLLAPLAGCLTVLKQGYAEIVGAQGTLLLINEVGPQALRPYQSISFESATTTMGEKLAPRTLISAYDDAAREMVRAMPPRAFPGGQPGLSVTSEVLYFQRKGLLSAAMSLVRVRISDDSRLIVDGVLRTESSSFRAGAEEDLAVASMKALREFLESQKGIEREED